jgi:hypothetical protein
LMVFVMNAWFFHLFVHFFKKSDGCTGVLICFISHAHFRGLLHISHFYCYCCLSFSSLPALPPL